MPNTPHATGTLAPHCQPPLAKLVLKPLTRAAHLIYYNSAVFHMPTACESTSAGHHGEAALSGNSALLAL